MRQTLTILEQHLEQLVGAVFAVPRCEGAAYLLCGRSEVEGERRLLVHEVHPVEPGDYRVRAPDRLSIASDSYARIAKRAYHSRWSILFVHSHPGGWADFSDQDDREEPELMRFFEAQAPDLIHGSLVISSPEQLRARLWTGDGWTPVERIRVLGRRFHFHGGTADQQVAPFFDRQVRAFGEDIQRLLATLHAGVVGAGGTGSPVAEQLVRLGVGRLTVFDGDTLEATNVTRVYGSTQASVGGNKAEGLAAHLRSIGLPTDVRACSTHISREAVARQLRECDVVFGCTDKEAPRAILVQLALRYLIPVFDVGVKVTSEEGTIRDVTGRVTLLMPGEACLFCRERISPERIRLELLPPKEHQALADEGYAPGLPTRDPAVVMFTTAVAAQAVTEFIHRLTGFMGEERRSSEVLQFFHEPAIRTNRQPPKAGCLCMRTEHWGRGDGRDFLGLLWPA